LAEATKVRTVGTTTTGYTWDQTGLGNVLSDGNEYVWGLGLISQIASGNPTYAHSDGLGSTRLQTDGTGTVVGTQDYDAFGATRSQTGVQLPFTYTGQQVDPESGLVYLRNRYLDPSTGRFQTPDPLGFAGSGVNLYAYVANSPLNATDPNGLGGPPDPDGLLTAEFGAMQEGIATDVGPREYFTYQWEAGLSNEEDAAAAVAEKAMAATDCPFAAEGEGSTILYRAVGPNERADIQQSGKYRLKYGGAEAKYFYPTNGQMEAFANSKWDVAKAYWGTSVEVTQSELAKADEISPLGEGKAYVFRGSDLPSGSITIMGRIH
jgi:RHS repeat-associated protein